MQKFKEFHQKLMYYVTNYSDLAFWAVMFVLFALTFWRK